MTDGRQSTLFRKWQSEALTGDEISEGTAALSPEIFWRAVGAASPPNVRYGTVLHSAFLF
jgi:hypothetical protein